MTTQLHEIAHRILADNPDPAVRVRLLRDVLKRPVDDPELMAARQRLNDSQWVRLLADEQHLDGGWGRFHTADAGLKQKTATTEQGVWRALALGLDATHPVLEQAADYCAALLRGEIPFPDPAEKNNRWETGWRMFTASVLAQIRPDDPAIDSVYDLWLTIAQRTFASGEYSQDAEITAHQELTGATITGFYLELQNRYALALLSSRELPETLETQLLDWLWTLPNGMHYLEAALERDSVPEETGLRERWFASLELLTHFKGWFEYHEQIKSLLWSAINDDGLWDFGKRSPGSVVFPLSEDWRRAGRRAHDWTTRVLTLLA